MDKISDKMTVYRYVLTRDFVMYDFSAVPIEFYPRFETGYQPRVAFKGQISDYDSVAEFDLLYDQILVSANTIEDLIGQLDELEFTDYIHFYEFDDTDNTADEIYDDGILLNNEDFISYTSIKKICIKDASDKLYTIAEKDDLGLWIIPMPKDMGEEEAQIC